MFKVDKEKCTGCGICVNACPTGAISMVSGKAQIDQDECINCGDCVQACPLNAIYADDETQQSIPQNQDQIFSGPYPGIDRGLGRGMGRGLRRGPRDGRGGGRGGGGGRRR
jgi:Fe-S-cluster-containing hydrogenase component 2